MWEFNEYPEAILLSKGLPCGDIKTIGIFPNSSPTIDSTASNTGSGLRTIPGPPPNG